VLVENAVNIVAEYPTVTALLDHWSSPPDTTKRMLVARLSSLDDVNLVARLETCFPGWPLLAIIEGDVDATGLFQVNRAGAAQMVPFPFERQDIDAALDRLLLQYGLRGSPGKVIAVSGVVEGCGATSIAMNLAAELAALSHVGVILTEMSLGMGRLASLMSLTPAATTRDLLDTTTEPNLGTVKAALTRYNDHLSVLLGQTRSLEPFAPATGRILDLLKVLRQLASYVVVDVPSTFDSHYFDVMLNAEQIYLVCRQDVPSVQTAKLVRDTLRERGLNSMNLIVNNYNSDHSEFSTHAIGKLLHLEPVTGIPTDVSGYQCAVAKGTVLRDVVPTSAVVKAIRGLAVSILERSGSAVYLPTTHLWDRLQTFLTRLRY
jgi:pilus assembly protein CpaE